MPLRFRLEIEGQTEDNLRDGTSRGSPARWTVWITVLLGLGGIVATVYIGLL